MSQLTYPESIVVGLLQGVTELFPISSLGHSVLFPALLGGQWKRDLNITGQDSPYLSVLVGLHLATALALMVFFWRDWVRIIRGLFTSIRHRGIESADEKLAWLLVISTIPVGIAGLALDHLLRSTLGKPIPAAAFLTANGVVLLAAERLRRGGSGRHHRATGENEYPRSRAEVRAPAMSYSVGDTNPDLYNGAPPPQAVEPGLASDQRIAGLSILSGTLIGAAQILALLPGISRSGATMCAGLLRGLNHEDAARFSFLLATPVIAAAAILKVPSLFDASNKGIWGPFLAGCVAAFVAGYVSVRFLTRYFETRTLTPFAIYCMIAGVGSLAYLSLT
jgi:undecaprenyl-diphosphatase